MRLAYALVCAGALALAGCSGTPGKKTHAPAPTTGGGVSQVIEPAEGGKVLVAEGAVAGSAVTIPGGAIDHPIEVTIDPGMPLDEVSLPAGPPIEVGPSGTEFMRPVTVELPYTEPLPPLGVGQESTPEDLVVTIRSAGGDVERKIPLTIDRQRHLVSVQTLHFSTFQAGVEALPDAMASTLSAEARSRPPIADGMDAVTLRVEVKSAQGLPVPHAKVTLATDGEGMAMATSETGADGRATASLTSTTPGGRTVRAHVETARAAFDLGPLVVEFSARAPVGLRFDQQPAGATAGAPIAPAIRVVLVDAGDRPVDVPDPVTLELVGMPGALGGTTTVTPSAGVATFTDLAIAKAGRGLQLRASAARLPPRDSQLFDVAAGPAAKVAFSRQPEGAIAGAALPPVLVTLLDAFDNAAGGDQLIALELQGAPPGTLGGTTMRTSTGGVASFDDLVIRVAGTGYRLVATPAMLPGGPATSDAFEVVHAAATALRLRGQPPSGVAGQPLSPALDVEVVDGFGNRVPEATGMVAVTMTQSPAGATLGGTRVRPLAGGAAAFPDLTVDRAGTCRLAAGVAGLQPADGMPFMVAAGPAARLAFRTHPVDGVAGTSLAAVVVEVQDALGNPVAGAAGNVSVSLQNGAGAAVAGTLTQPLVAGAATFPDLRIDRAGAGYSLAGTSAALAAAASRAFAIAPGAASALAFDASPGGAVAGTAITPAPTVRVLDAFANQVKTSTASIRVALGANPGGATLGGTATVAAAAGAATFPDLALTRVGSGYTLVASSSGLTDATTAAFAVAHGAPSRLVLLSSPANTTTGAALTSLQVAIEDALGNRATTATSTVSVALGANPGGASLGGTTSTAAVAGVASFGNLTVNRPGTGYALVVSSGVLPSVTSTPFDVVAIAARLVFAGQPLTAIFGLPLGGPITVEVQDALGNRATTGSTTVSLILGTNPNGAQLGGVLAVGSTNGQAVFSNVVLDRAGLGYTLSASASGLGGATSTSFNSSQFVAVDGLGHLDGGSSMDFSFANPNDSLNGAQLNQAWAVELDRVRHRLFVADRNAHRVLVFQLSGSDDFNGTGIDRRADVVIGQGDFHAAGPGTTATSLRNPAGLAYDPTGDRLFVADTDNNRVLVFNTANPTNGMAASLVLGQADFVTGTPATSATGLRGPVGLRYLGGDRLAVADEGNHRVLVHAAAVGTIASGQAATLAIGQQNLTNGSSGLAQNRLTLPKGVTGGDNRLFVADTGNHRVLVFDEPLSTNMNATFVIGQTSFSSGGFAPQQDRLSSPVGLFHVDGDPWLWVADYGNSRVLRFAMGSLGTGMPAANVLGKPNYTSGGTQTTPGGMNQPTGITVGASGALFASEQGNNRVLRFDVSGTVTDGQAAGDGLGHLEQGVMSFSRGQPSDAPNAYGFNDPADTAIDAAGHRLFVLDRQNSRVLVFNLGPSNDLVGGTPGQERLADFVIGQPDFSTVGCGGGATGFCAPERLLYDGGANQLLVADNQQNRILVFGVASITNGMAATLVLGQTGFASTGAATSATGLSDPWGMAIDPNGRLFVADRANHRVLGYPLGSLATGMAATLVLGEPDFTSAAPATTAAGMRGPTDVAWDATGGRLFVADQANHRVLAYFGTLSNGMAAGNVLGQADFTSSAQAHTATGMSFPVGLAVDASLARLLVSDQGNNRVLVFKLGGPLTNGGPALTSMGEPSFTGGGSGPSMSMSIPNGLDSVGGRMYLADSNGHRVTLWYP